jgi:EF hand
VCYRAFRLPQGPPSSAKSLSWPPDLAARPRFNLQDLARVDQAREMPMKKLLCSALATATLLTIATSSFADGEDVKARIAKRVDAVFAKLDADKDGRISRDEAAKGPRLSKTFDKVDADKDGYVSRAELSAAIEHRAKRGDQAPR